MAPITPKQANYLKILIRGAINASYLTGIPAVDTLTVSMVDTLTLAQASQAIGALVGPSKAGWPTTNRANPAISLANRPNPLRPRSARSNAPRQNPALRPSEAIMARINSQATQAWGIAGAGQAIRNVGQACAIAYAHALAFGLVDGSAWQARMAAFLACAASVAHKATQAKRAEAKRWIQDARYRIPYVNRAPSIHHGYLLAYSKLMLGLLASGSIATMAGERPRPRLLNPAMVRHEDPTMARFANLEIS